MINKYAHIYSMEHTVSKERIFFFTPISDAGSAQVQFDQFGAANECFQYRISDLRARQT